MLSVSRYFISARPAPSSSGFPDSSARTQTRSPLNRMRTQDIRRTMTDTALGRSRARRRRVRGALLVPRRLPARGRRRRRADRAGPPGAVSRRRARRRRRRRRRSCAPAPPPPRSSRWRPNRRPTRTTLAEFQRRTGFDPLKQLTSLTVAFPEDARGSGDFGLVLRADRFDEARLVAYARDELQKNGDDLVATKRGRLTLWSSKRDPTRRRLLHRRRTRSRWARAAWGDAHGRSRGQDQPGDSAATNLELVRLVERAAGTHAIWGAAIVPAETRRTLAAQPGLGRRGDDQHAVGRDRLRQGRSRRC